MLQTITEAQSRRIGYKMLFSVCSEPAEVLGRIDGVPVSPEVADCELAAAEQRVFDTHPFHAIIEAAAAWMADVVVDDVTSEDDDPEMLPAMKDEYASDFAAFGVALLGVLLEEHVIAPVLTARPHGHG
jgi:hypothetical protein